MPFHEVGVQLDTHALIARLHPGETGLLKPGHMSVLKAEET